MKLLSRDRYFHIPNFFLYFIICKGCPLHEYMCSTGANYLETNNGKRCRPVCKRKETKHVKFKMIKLVAVLCIVYNEIHVIAEYE